MPRHKSDPALLSLARILRGLRVQRGLEEGRAEWIAARVAKRAGTAPGVVSACELGSSRPSREMLERLLDALRAGPETREEALRLHAASVEAGAAEAHTALQARKADLAQVRAAACDRFRAGESVGSIAASLILRESTVKIWLRSAGLSLPRPERAPSVSSRILQGLAAGELPGAIAANVGCSKRRVFQERYLASSRGLAFDRAAFHAARTKAGYRSVAQLAGTSGISPRYCCLVARGMVPSPQTRAKIAAALGVPESALWLPTSPHG